MSPLPSKLPFYAYAQYSPRGTSTASVASRDFTYKVKQDGFIAMAHGTERAIDFIAQRIKDRLAEYPFLNDCFGPDVVLIPIPRSSPLKDQNALWPTKRIAEALVAQGLGSQVVPCLVRTQPVQKSSQAAPGQRPSPQDHFDSVALVPQLPIVRPQRITLIDDVITRGSTFLGVYPHIERAFPQATIACFALIRTMSGVEIDSPRAPVQGEIRMAYGRPHRDP